MRKNWKTLMATTTVIAAVAGGSAALYAQSATPLSSKSGDGMMMQGHEGDMMNMMGQMSQMMETCNNMMKDMAKDHRPETQKEGKSPEKKG